MAKGWLTSVFAVHTLGSRAPGAENSPLPYVRRSRVVGECPRSAGSCRPVSSSCSRSSPSWP
jgi:hypothetical protein